MQIKSSLDSLNKNSFTAQNNNERLENTSFHKLLIKENSQNNIHKEVPVHLEKYDDSKLTQEQFDKLIDKLDLNYLTQDEKELYKSIIDNGYISNEEIKGLSYEEMKTLGKFVFKKDESGEYIDETLLNSDIKAGTLLSTAVISDNDEFNESVFKMVENLEKDEDITSFMYLITGTFHSNKLIAFPQLQEIDYKGKDIKEFLEDKISTFEGMLEVSANNELSKVLKSVINQFDDLLSLFNSISKNKDEPTTKSSYEVDITQKLIDDLISLMETGLTKTELESIEKLMNQIKEKIEDSKEKKVSEDKIRELIKELEDKIKQIQKRVIGNDKIEIEKDSKNIKDDELSLNMQEFKSILQSLKIALEETKEKAANKTNPLSSHEELTLINQFNRKY
jgi:hypothetical protein